MTEKRQKVAIVGTGIAGMAAAYLLQKRYDITVFEKNDYIGGHTRTLEVDCGGVKTPVDTGFIVFNHRNYPNLTGLFKQLGVPTKTSDMSFGVSIDKGWLEYSSCKGALFSQKFNFIRPTFYKMLFDIVRFNKHAMSMVEKHPEDTLGDLVKRMRLGKWFQNYYLLPMGGAIWSCPVEQMLAFPASSFVQFFKNHGLMDPDEHLQWHTVHGGSYNYVKRLVYAFESKVKLNSPVKKIMRTKTKVKIGRESFDHVVIAAHANEALEMLDAPTAKEKKLLGAFDYQENKVVLHRDTSHMPVRKKAWASWVYLLDARKDEEKRISLTYWMNKLQSLNEEYPLFVSVNPKREIAEDALINEHVFTHPVFTMNALKAQEELPSIQGQNNTWYCGSYHRHGFHEDAIASAVDVAKRLGVYVPWAS